MLHAGQARVCTSGASAIVHAALQRQGASLCTGCNVSHTTEHTRNTVHAMPGRAEQSCRCTALGQGGGGGAGAGGDGGRGGPAAGGGLGGAPHIAGPRGSGAGGAGGARAPAPTAESGGVAAASHSRPPRAGCLPAAGRWARPVVLRTLLPRHLPHYSPGRFITVLAALLAWYDLPVAQTDACVLSAFGLLQVLLATDLAPCGASFTPTRCRMSLRVPTADVPTTECSAISTECASVHAGGGQGTGSWWCWTTARHGAGRAA